jgi:hypothetical protein
MTSVLCDHCFYVFLTGSGQSDRFCPTCLLRLRDMPLTGPASLDKYLLPPIAHVRQFLSGIEAPSATRQTRTQVFVWGYQPCQCPLILQQFRDTPEARHFAAERGWDANAEGAWAKEMVSPLFLSQLVRELAPLFRSERSIRGWGGKSCRR